MLKSCHVNKFVNKLLVGFPPPSFPWIRGIGKLGSTPSLWEPHWPKTGWRDDKFKLCLLLFLRCWGPGSSVMSAEFKEWSETPFCHWKNRPGSQNLMISNSFSFPSNSDLQVTCQTGHEDSWTPGPKSQTSHLPLSIAGAAVTSGFCW